jgi:hypothetical protein
MTGVSGHGTAASVMPTSGNPVAAICPSMRSSSSMIGYLLFYDEAVINSHAKCVPYV